MTMVFPDLPKIGWESSKEQKWETAVQRSGSGRTVTNTNQLLPRWVITVNYPMLTDNEARKLQGFVAALKGAHEPFFWLDPEDYECKNQVLAPIGNNQYQAVMVQGEYVEAVDFIDKVSIFVDGVKQLTGFTVDGGIITFTIAPVGEVTADYRYYWKVMLLDDGIAISRKFKNCNKVALKMEVVR